MLQCGVGRALLLGLLASLSLACERGAISVGEQPPPVQDMAAIPVDMRVLPDMTILWDLTVPKPLVISEIMYHPVDENAPQDNHEFLEIHNPAEVAVDLSGWKITGDAAFTFPPGARIAAHEYKVIAHNKAQLAAVADYKLNAADLLGDFTGELGDDGTVNLVDAKGQTVDSATWSASFPWPIGADGPDGVSFPTPAITIVWPSGL